MTKTIVICKYCETNVTLHQLRISECTLKQIKYRLLFLCCCFFLKTKDVYKLAKVHQTRQI
jgi:hypothetical protein